MRLARAPASARSGDAASRCTASAASALAMRVFSGGSPEKISARSRSGQSSAARMRSAQRALTATSSRAPLSAMRWALLAGVSLQNSPTVIAPSDITA